MKESDDIFSLRDEEPTPVVGSMLVAKPTVDDWCFSRSVSLVIDHGENGSMALMMSHLSGFTVGDVMPQFEALRNQPLYLGGPVGTDMLFYVHDLGSDIVPEALQIVDGLWLGGDLTALTLHCDLEPHFDIERHVKFMIGYSGWTAGQLADELARHDWAVLDGDARRLLLLTPHDAMWQRAVERFGPRYHLWLNWPTDVAMN